MSLVTVDRYRAITGDAGTAAALVSARLEEALGMLEEDLGRPLESVERTETMWYDRAGFLYPMATPVTAATGWEIEGNALRGGVLAGTHVLLGPSETVNVTYTGGFVERTANPGAANALPVHIERDLAFAAYALGNADQIAAGMPSGARSVAVGDVSVSFGAEGVHGSADDLRIRWSRATRRHKRRGL
jgi:hypothetical protein